MLILQKKTEEIITENFLDGFIDSVWFWIAIVELSIIVYLLIKVKNQNQNLTFNNIPKSKLNAVKTANIDMDGLMQSINGSRDLYKELSKVCHPDRFINTVHEKIANDIFQEISMNKKDFKELTKLKERAKIELNIKFKKNKL
jgi:hypothetical protein